MRRFHLAFVVVVAVAGLAGCGSSSSSGSSGGSGDMDQMAAAMHEPAATVATGTARSAAPATVAAASATAAGDSPTAAAAPAAQPAATAPPAAPVAADPALRTKRGFELEDWSNEAVYVFVKADAGKAAEAVARMYKGKVKKDVYGKPAGDHDGVFVFQLAGHPWSIFATHGSQIDSLKTLSSEHDVLVIWNSDFNAWSGIDLYRRGQEVESLHWGPEGDGLGEDADAAKWHSKGMVAHTFEGITLNEVYQFRSTLRKVSEAELNKGEEFLDAMLGYHDAYLPDMEQMPWPDGETSVYGSPLGPPAFAGVHAVEVAEPLQ